MQRQFACSPISIDAMDEAQFRSHLGTLAFDQTLQADETQGASTAPTSIRGAVKLVSHDGTSTSPEYALGPTIGEGGMGIVRLAAQAGLRRDVAIKTLRDENHSETDRLGLLHEALVTGGLEHPNIVPIYALSQTADGAPAIVMKRIEGVSWYACMKDPSLAPGFDGQDLLGWHLDVLSQVCLAVHFAHSKGIVHRDIKPENVMLGSFGEVYLVDWGIAVTVDSAKADYLLHAEDANGVAGSPAYMAPEMATGRGADIGRHTDVYLLGSTLSEILRGRPPHTGNVLIEVLYSAYRSVPVTVADAPPELLAICHKAMHATPEKRYSSADALRTALHEYSTHRASAALANEAVTRLERLQDLVEDDDADDASVRGLAGEVRFGLKQSLKIWPANAVATEAQLRWITLMALWELKTGNLSAAERISEEIPELPPHLAAEFAKTRDRIAKQEANMKRLEALREDVDQGHGARFRVWGAVVAIVVWTFLPITAGIGTGWGDNPLSQEQYLARALLVPVSILAFWVVLLRRSSINQATRNIMRIMYVFALLIPLFRFVATRGDISSVQALSIEQLVYGLVFATVAIQSGRSGALGLVFYGAASAACTTWPDYTYAFLSAANFASLTWLARIWASQVQSDEPAGERS